MSGVLVSENTIFWVTKLQVCGTDLLSYDPSELVRWNTRSLLRICKMTVSFSENEESNFETIL